MVPNGSLGNERIRTWCCSNWNTASARWETLDQIVKSYVHNALASGPKGAMVATSGNETEAMTHGASCDDPRRGVLEEGARWRAGVDRRDQKGVLGGVEKGVGR